MRTLFALLSLADLVLTWWLLNHAGSLVYESNPVAGWCLATAGWFGLVAFKVGLVALVLGLVALVGRSRPRIGRTVLTFGCAVLVLVVGYSSVLALHSRGWEDAEFAAVERFCAERDRHVAEDCRLRLAYSTFRDGLAQSLLAGRLTLPAGIAKLATSERLSDRAWLLGLPSYEDCSYRECLARQLLASVSVAAFQMSNRARTQKVFRRLEAEYRAAFGRAAPADLLRSP